MSKCAFLLVPILAIFSCTSILNVSTTASGREEMLQEIAPKFHKDLYWKIYVKMAENISPAFREQYFRSVKQSGKTERIMDIEVINIDFFEDSKKAHVNIQIKSFKEPRYMVETRKEKESWSFVSLNGGWLLENVEREK